MKRYEYPPKIARVSAGLLFAFCDLLFWFADPPPGWTITVVCLMYAPLLALRPMQYVVLKNGELLYSRLIGRGRIVLSDVKSITSSRRQWPTLHTTNGRLRLPGVLTDYWECLQRVVDGAKNAEIDSYTRELLDKDSAVHRKLYSFLRMFNVSANIVLPGAAVLGFVWLMYSILTR